MSMLAIAAATTAAKLIGGAINKSNSKKKRQDAENNINAETAIESAGLSDKYGKLQQAETDLGNVYEGQTSISPEAKFARDVSERQASAQINRAIRTGKSSGDVMAQAAGAASQNQQNQNQIGAQEAARRREAQRMAKAQGIRAAQSGLAGQEAQINLKDKAHNRKMSEYNMINQQAAQNYDYFSGAVGDLGSAAMMASASTDASGVTTYNNPIKFGKKKGG